MEAHGLGAHLSSMRLLSCLNRRNFKTTKRNLPNFFQETSLGMQESIPLDRPFPSPTWGLTIKEELKVWVWSGTMKSHFNLGLDLFMDTWIPPPPPPPTLLSQWDQSFHIIKTGQQSQKESIRLSSNKRLLIVYSETLWFFWEILDLAF